MRWERGTTARRSILMMLTAGLPPPTSWNCACQFSSGGAPAPDSSGSSDASAGALMQLLSPGSLGAAPARVAGGGVAWLPWV